MKIISYSLWGDNPRYTLGTIKNVELAKEIFPDWKVKIFYDNTVPNHIIQQLNTHSNVILEDMSSNTISPYFWRFFELFVSDENVILSRDVDSRLSLREKSCVDFWLSSNKKYIVIRDHVRHYDFPVLAGMWGIKGKFNKEYFDLMLQYGQQNFYTIDQIYIQDILWNIMKQDCYIFGIHENEQFNLSRKNILPHFIGQGYDENDIPIYPSE